MNYTTPGANYSYQDKAYAVRSYSLTPPDASHPIQPLVSPVTSPMINGQSLFYNRVGVGLTPTITWAAPDLGASQGYRIAIYRLGISNQVGSSYFYSNSTRVARIFVDGSQSSVTLPAGILESGKYYYFNIRAIADSTYDPTSAPKAARRFAFGVAEVLTNMITP